MTSNEKPGTPTAAGVLACLKGTKRMAYPRMDIDLFLHDAGMGLDISMEYKGKQYYVGRRDDAFFILTDTSNSNVMYARDVADFLDQYMIEGQPLRALLPHMRQVWL